MPCRGVSKVIILCQGAQDPLRSPDSVGEGLVWMLGRIETVVMKLEGGMGGGAAIRRLSNAVDGDKALDFAENNATLKR